MNCFLRVISPQLLVKNDLHYFIQHTKMNYKELYQKSLDNPDVFWKEQAENIQWFR